jgi:hypothetical protein
MSIPNHFIAGVIVLAGSLVIAGPAPTAESQAWTWCVNRNNAYSPDLAIGGCTTVIQSGKETKGNLSIAFKNRGAVVRVHHFVRRGDDGRVLGRQIGAPAEQQHVALAKRVAVDGDQMARGGVRPFLFL